MFQRYQVAGAFQRGLQVTGGVLGLALASPGLFVCRFPWLPSVLHCQWHATDWMAQVWLLLGHQPALAALLLAALDVSNQSVFVGDSWSTIHIWRAEVEKGAAGGGQLARLVWQTKLKIGAADVKAPIVGCQYVPFCAATDSPLLLVTSRPAGEGVVAVVRVHEVSGGSRSSAGRPLTSVHTYT